MSKKELSKEAKYTIINSTITYIEELTTRVYDKHLILNKFIDDLELTDEEIDAPLCYLSNNEGGDMLRQLIKEKLGIEDDSNEKSN